MVSQEATSLVCQMLKAQVMYVCRYILKRGYESTHIYNLMYSLKPRAIIHISEQLVVECRLIRNSLYTATITLYMRVWAIYTRVTSYLK